MVLEVNKFDLKVALGIPLQFHEHMRMLVIIASGRPRGSPRLGSVV